MINVSQRPTLKLPIKLSEEYWTSLRLVRTKNQDSRSKIQDPNKEEQYPKKYQISNLRELSLSIGPVRIRGNSGNLPAGRQLHGQKNVDFSRSEKTCNKTQRRILNNLLRFY